MDETTTSEPTAAELVIAKFGGLTKMARALGYAVSTVQGWKERGTIPQDHWRHILATAARDTVDVSVNDFLGGPIEASAQASAA